jgi:hypothetical protein
MWQGRFCSQKNSGDQSSTNDREAILERLEKTCRILDGFVFAKSKKKTENEIYQGNFGQEPTKNQGKHNMIRNK